MENSEKLTKAMTTLDRLMDEQHLKAFFKTLLSRLPHLMVVVDNNGKIIFWNNNWEKVFGYSEIELYRRRLFDFLAPEDLERTLKTFSEVKQKEGYTTLNRPFRNTFITKKGDRILLEWEKESPKSELFVYAFATIVG